MQSLKKFHIPFFCLLFTLSDFVFCTPFYTSPLFVQYLQQGNPHSLKKFVIYCARRWQDQHAELLRIIIVSYRLFSMMVSNGNVWKRFCMHNLPLNIEKGVLYMMKIDNVLSINPTVSFLPIHLSVSVVHQLLYHDMWRSSTQVLIFHSG